MLRIPGRRPQDQQTSSSAPGSASPVAGSSAGSTTHVLRLSRRLELTTNDDPVKVERDLMAILPQDRWIDFAHQLIHHGRRI